MGKWLVGLLTAAAAAIAVAAPAAAESVVYQFVGGTDGAAPSGGVAIDAKGNLYGATQDHGIFGCDSAAVGCGVVYRLTPGRVYSVLWRFTGPPDGYGPVAAPAVDPTSGALYGTTQYGGTGSCSSSSYTGCGSVFELAPPKHRGDPWTESVLYDFCSQSGCADGAFPSAGLVEDAKGALYGTVNGGAGNGGSGAVFRLKPPKEKHAAWHFDQLYVFCAQANCADGASPNAQVSFDAAGNLYGTTSFGGANNEGVVFELTPPAHGEGLWSETVLYNFCGATSCGDGSAPVAGVAVDGQGNLYGTTTGGGSAGAGVVYRLAAPAGAANWQYAVLKSLDGGTEGDFPKSMPLLDASGNLYTSASFGGGGPCNFGCGTVFRLTPHRDRWSFSLLHKFDAGGSGSDGTQPQGNLVFGGNGRLLGTTVSGGSATYGTIWKLQPPTP
jgi:uncharacterized repeat protein (TIGR03803 family)